MRAGVVGSIIDTAGRCDLWYHSGMQAKTFTVRIPVNVYDRAYAHRKTSLSRFVQEAIEEKLRRVEQEEIEKSLLCLAGEEHDPYWQDAQRRSTSHGD